MLEARDTEWRDVGTRRQAFYTDLAPGSYRFRVRGSNNSGVWNEASAVLEFSIVPAYYQTRWFQALVVAAALSLVWAGYVARLPPGWTPVTTAPRTILRDNSSTPSRRQRQD